MQTSKPLIVMPSPDLVKKSGYIFLGSKAVQEKAEKRKEISAPGPLRACRGFGA